MKKLFLAHFSGDASEVSQLANALRLRGIVPWVDKQGGFTVGDMSEREARRAIRDDCFGLLLWASADVFERPFIRNVEMDEARHIQASNQSYLIISVLRDISFGELSERSKKCFGINLADFHGVALIGTPLTQESVNRVASEVLRSMLRHRHIGKPDARLGIQFSTREVLADYDEDILRIDAVGELGGKITDQAAWNRVIIALSDVKREISQVFGRPRLHISGSKHLSSAFIFGLIFSPFALDIRQTTTQIWSGDLPVTLDVAPFEVTTQKSDVTGLRLFLEVASRYKNVSADVDEFIRLGQCSPSIRLQLHPPYGNALDMDNHLCKCAVQQTHAEVEKVINRYPSIREIHVFCAVPQAFMMMLGQAFKATPPIHLYEWRDGKYEMACCIDYRTLY